MCPHAGRDIADPGGDASVLVEIMFVLDAGQGERDPSSSAVCLTGPVGRQFSPSSSHSAPLLILTPPLHHPPSPPTQRGRNEEAPSTQELPPHAQHYAAVREFRDSLSRIRLLEALQTRPSGVVRVKGILLLDEDATHEPPTRASKGFHEINCSADEVALCPIIRSVGPSQIVAISDGSISPESTEGWLSDTVSFCTVSGTSGHSTELSSPST